MSRRLFPLLSVLVPLLFAALPAAAGEARTPFCRVFDTAVPSPTPLPPSALAKGAGWRNVPEDDRSHAFAGDAVLANDKLAVVVRQRGRGAEVYSQSAAGLQRRASLVPRHVNGDHATGLSAVRIVENTPAAATLAAEYRTNAGTALPIRYRLTTGVVFVEARPDTAVNRVLVSHGPRFVVVPDFFADDAVFGADPADPDRVGLPAETHVLGLVGEGEAIVMTVWESSEQEADLVLEDRPAGRTIRGCEIDCAGGKRIWVAFLEGRDIWHHRTLTPTDSAVTVDWTPPFPAKWRLSVAGAGNLAQSQAYRPPIRLPPRSRGRHLIMYPLERSRATPLTVLCPIDIMRDTLGVGPCEYVLDVEGIGSEVPATPDAVTPWVERQFKGKREARSADAIKKRLDKMVAQVGRIEARIEDYHAFAQRVRRLCENALKSPATADLGRRLIAILDDMDSRIGQGKTMAPRRAAELSAAMVALIGRPNPLDQCERLGAQIRTVGAAQDRALAAGRMAARRLKQQCRIAVASQSAADLAKAVRRQAEGILRRK